MNRSAIRGGVAALTAAALVACSSSGGGSEARSEAASGSAAGIFAHKTVTLLVATTPGGTFDLVARALQKVLPKYLPGKPKVIVQNQPGADHLVGDLTVARSKPDGLTVGFANSRGWQDKVTGANADAGFDPTKMVYLGTPAEKPPAFLWCANREKITGPDVWAGLLASGKTVTAAAVETGSASNLIPASLQLKGQPVKMVYGYAGGPQLFQAFTSGESDTLTFCASDQTAQYPDLYSKKELAPIAWAGVAPSQDYLNTMGWDGPPPPEVYDLPGVTFTQAEKDAIDLAAEMEGLDKAMFVAPGTPQSIVDAWSAAIKSATMDAGFRETLTAAGIIPAFAPPDSVDKAYQDVANLSPDGVKFLEKLNNA
jgi:tripartite-type tricarboxylate transporter receptor subunit TctC